MCAYDHFDPGPTECPECGRGFSNRTVAASTARDASSRSAQVGREVARGSTCRCGRAYGDGGMAAVSKQGCPVRRLMEALNQGGGTNERHQDREGRPADHQATPLFDYAE